MPGRTNRHLSIPCAACDTGLAVCENVTKRTQYGDCRADEGIVNGWLFVRYLVIGLYVGLATVGGFAWWFLDFQVIIHLAADVELPALSSMINDRLCLASSTSNTATLLHSILQVAAGQQPHSSTEACSDQHLCCYGPSTGHQGRPDGAWAKLLELHHALGPHACHTRGRDAASWVPRVSSCKGMPESACRMLKPAQHQHQQACQTQHAAYVRPCSAAGTQDGPRVSWRELTHAQQCQGSGCEAFKSRAPSTVAMTVLVVVEMFNALNALSENASLLQLPPWSNRCAWSGLLRLLQAGAPSEAGCATVRHQPRQHDRLQHCKTDLQS